MNQEEPPVAAIAGGGASSTPKVQATHLPKLKFWGHAATAIVSAFIGSVLGRLFPPFVLDDEFWRTFLTSAGFGGVAALAAAIIAFLATWYTGHRNAANVKADRLQREQAAENDRLQREAADQHSQWWARFTWAAEAAIGTVSRDVGTTSMIGLIHHPWASAEDADIAIAVADVLDQLQAESEFKLALNAEEGVEE